VVEVKSGGPEKAHAIQTALQALLAELTTRVPADAIGRFAEYLKPNGRAYIERFERRADFDEARKIIRACCAN
jgi:hypothetical protein